MLSLTAQTVRTIAGTGSSGHKPKPGPAASAVMCFPASGVLDPFDAGGGPADVLLRLAHSNELWRVNRRTGVLVRTAIRPATFTYAVAVTPCGWLLRSSGTFLEAVDPRDGRTVRLTGLDTKKGECVDGPLATARFGRIASIALDADARPPRAIVVCTCLTASHGVAARRTPFWRLN